MDRKLAGFVDPRPEDRWIAIRVAHVAVPVVDAISVFEGSLGIERKASFFANEHIAFVPNKCRSLDHGWTAYSILLWRRSSRCRSRKTRLLRDVPDTKYAARRTRVTCELREKTNRRDVVGRITRGNGSPKYKSCVHPTVFWSRWVCADPNGLV